jgi:nucleolar protein 58
LEHQLEGGAVRRFAGENSGKKQQRFEMKGETKTYNTAGDYVDLVPTQREDVSSPHEAALQVVLDVKEEKRKAKEERKAKKRAEKEKQKETSQEAEGEGEENEEEDSMDVDGESKKRKEKKRKRRESDQNQAVPMDEDGQEDTSTKVSEYFSSHR